MGATRADGTYSHACGCYLYDELGMWVLPICMWVLLGQMVPTPMHVGATPMHVGSTSMHVAATKADGTYSHICGCY